jgi:hypothetical protein
MTYLASSAGALITDRNTWHTRADTAYGASRVWSSGSSFETDLTNMTNDRNYWKTTVAHDDPNVWTNRYNAGVSAANAALPAAYQLTAVVNSNSYTTTETTLRTITVNRTGYWWAACSLINADGGTVANCTARLRMAGTQIAVVTFFNFVNGGAGSGLVSTSTPVLVSNGQTIILTAQQSSGSVPSVSSALLVAGFVPTPSYPQ